jgi:DNA-binding transcriptional ArsR family regulator
MPFGYASRMPTAAASPQLQHELLHGLADPSRLQILSALRGGQLRVADIVQQTGLSQPNVSKHLRCLLGCGLVEREQRGREAHYAPVEDLGALFRALDELLDRVADRISGCELTATTLDGDTR